MPATVLYQNGNHFSVPKSPPSHRASSEVLLTPHDYEVLNTLYLCGCLTTKMLRDWQFVQYRSAAIWCRERLRDYIRQGWVEELRCPKKDKEFWRLDQSRFMYRLTKSGVKQLFRARQRPLRGLKWKDFEEFLQRQTFRHLMELNKVLSHAFATAPEADVSIDHWEHDEALKKKEAPLVFIKVHDGPKRKRGITPDATLMVSLPSSTQPRLCFLEVERGTVTGAYSPRSKSFAVGRRDWRQKVLAMIAYYTSQNDGEPSLVEQEYGTESLRILTTFHSEQRLAYKKKLTEVNGGSDGRWWFTTLERLLTPGVNYWTSTIWQVAGWEGLHKLV